VLVDIEGALRDVLIGYSRVPLANLASKQITFGGECCDDNDKSEERG
jgi:hypothetical protein